ncbi:MAG: serine hydroxymethyltransferase, partial [Anaerolineae bacterium]|nr:serine hydroxymethyltransferase [Anaerolineae bacterium]
MPIRPAVLQFSVHTCKDGPPLSFARRRPWACGRDAHPPATAASITEIYMSLDDFLFRGDLADMDPDVADLINLEAERQMRRLILIPSEATIPWAVRQALSSPFHNIYAEGYPPEETRQMTEAHILDLDYRLADFRRYADPRYYKGTEFADAVEALARRRAAEIFATEKYSADKLWVNVQPLSGAPANSAVYTALIQPGDTIMGMDLLHGGHLTHGSPAARSGKQYRAVFYGVDPATERIEYDRVREIALAEKPKIIIAGYSSYPWTVDWARFRQIADEAGALLMADVAHVAGLIVAGVYPSPVGLADIVTFTTHKTLGGPRGAVIITHRADMGRKLDRGVFPGEQGGPHMNTIAALAVALKLASTGQFKALQEQTVRNAMHLAAALAGRGVKLVYGGTNTHLLNVDCRPFTGPDGSPLSGDMAARLLDLVGVTCNRNTIPGDDSAARPSGIRMGTPWITQRGFKEPEIEALADIIADVLSAARPFSYDGKGGRADLRAKIPFDALQAARRAVAELCDAAGIDYSTPVVGSRAPERGRDHVRLWAKLNGESGPAQLEIRGPGVRSFLRYALTSPVLALRDGESEPSSLLDADGALVAQGALTRISEDLYQLAVEANGERAAAWLQALSDGFVVHDEGDLYGKLPGPFAVRRVPVTRPPEPVDQHALAASMARKAYFVGAHGARLSAPACPALPVFTWEEPADAPLKRTPLFDLHKALGAKIVPFAGYEMPVWYKGVSQEHAAVRTEAGLFDVSHMGVWEVSGPDAEYFLSGLTSNDVLALAPGEAHYSYLLGVDGVPLDDMYLYRLGADRFMMVVNASNNDKDWAWANAVRDGAVMIDPARPGAALVDDPSRVTLRDLRAPSTGADRRVDIALQGPKSQDILLSLP